LIASVLVFFFSGSAGNVLTSIVGSQYNRISTTDSVRSSDDSVRSSASTVVSGGGKKYKYKKPAFCARSFFTYLIVLVLIYIVYQKISKNIA
jgi:hypothetical protein